MKYSQIKHMVDRFLMWKLPDNFSPDNGISAVRPNYAPEVSWEPTGTNLLDATQAEAMVRHMVEGLADEQEEPNPEWEAKADTHHAATLAKVGVEPLQTLKMLERWKADAEPANEFGQVTFSRALLDSATDALRAVIAAQIDTAYEGRLGGEYEVLLTTEALIKVRNLALRRLELGAPGSDDDGIALAAFQVEATPKTVLTIANALLRQQHSDLDLMALLGKRTAERDELTLKLAEVKRESDEAVSRVHLRSGELRFANAEIARLKVEIARLRQQVEWFQAEAAKPTPPSLMG